MIIQVKKIKTITKETRAGDREYKQIIGAKSDGTTYTKDIMINKYNSDILNAIEDFGVGDFMELKYDDSPYANVKSVEPTDGFPANAYKPKQAGGNYSSNNVRRKDGTSRGDDTNRSASIYLAQSILGKWDEDAEPVDTYLANLMYLGTRVFAYITKGEIVSPKETVDSLEPPEV